MKKTLWARVVAVTVGICISWGAHAQQEVKIGVITR